MPPTVSLKLVKPGGLLGCEVAAVAEPPELAFTAAAFLRVLLAPRLAHAFSTFLSWIGLAAPNSDERLETEPLRFEDFHVHIPDAPVWVSSRRRNAPICTG
jgi:hypothetical protein